VYFGLPAFNARQRAANFSLDELPRLMQYLHDRNVKGYVTLNTLVFSDELPEAARYVRAIAEAGADAVIVQDLGVARLIRRMVPSLPVHASTQMTQTEPEGIAMLHGLGIRRVIIARELSIEELQEVVEAAAVELEVFVHGALCISYSGQCLASASLWDRSANRGLCAQACRLPYKLLIDGRSLDLRDQRYLLSASDLCAADYVCQLARMGVAGFKIEGRLKDAAYVAAVTRFYRKAIDAAVAGEAFAASPADRAELEMAFSRGMGPGYLAGTNHQTLVHGRFPKKRGLFVGTVVGVTPRGVLVELVRELVGPAPVRQTPGFAAGAANDSSERTTTMLLKPGDGVVFDAGSSPENEQGGRVYAVTSRATDRGRVELTFGRGDVDFAAISVGSGVWKTDDPQFRRCLDSLSRQDSPQHRCPVTLRVRLLLDGRLQATLVDESGREASAASDGPLEPARKHPLTVELLQDQFCRLGDTPFRLDCIEMNSTQGPAESLPVMAPKSVLNDLRRRAAAQLKTLRDRDRRHDVIEPHALERNRREMADALRRPGDQLPPGSAPVRTAQLAVLVRDLQQLDAALDWASKHASRRRLACVYGDFGRLADCDAAVRAAREAKQKLALAVPQVVMPGEQDLLERIAACRPDAVLVRSRPRCNSFAGGSRKSSGSETARSTSQTRSRPGCSWSMACRPSRRPTKSVGRSWRRWSVTSGRTRWRSSSTNTLRCSIRDTACSPPTFLGRAIAKAASNLAGAARCCYEIATTWTIRSRWTPLAATRSSTPARSLPSAICRPCSRLGYAAFASSCCTSLRPKRSGCLACTPTCSAAGTSRRTGRRVRPGSEKSLAPPHPPPTGDRCDGSRRLTSPPDGDLPSRGNLGYAVRPAGRPIQAPSSAYSLLLR